MSIRPISPVSYTNGYNQVNFEGRKNRQNNENGNSFSNPVHHKLAVPLAATILAINSASVSAKPLDTVVFEEPNKIEMVDEVEQSSQKVFASKTFTPKYSAGLGHYTPQVKLINTKGGTGFDKIVYSMILNDRSNLDSELGEVIGINNSRLTIMGDDGSKGRTFSSKTLKLKKDFSDELAVSKEEIKYIEDAINSADNHGQAKMYNYNKGLRLTYRELQNVPNGDIMKDAQPMVSSFGQLCADGVLDGDKERYMLRIYSPDGSGETADDMTLQKDGYPELQVRGIYRDVVTINPKMANEKNFEYGKVMLVGKDKNGKRKTFFIQDDVLTSKIARFFDQNKVDILKEVVEKQERDTKYLVEDGMIMPIIE